MCPFLMLHSIPLCESPLFSIRPPIDGWLGCFQVGAFTNHVSEGTWVPVCGAHLSASCIAIGTAVGLQGNACSAGADTASFLSGCEN